MISGKGPIFEVERNEPWSCYTRSGRYLLYGLEAVLRSSHKTYLSTDRKRQILATATTESGISQSARRLPTGWTVRSLTPGENKISLHTRPDRPWGPPSSCTLGNRDLSSGSGKWGVAFSTLPQRALGLRMSRTYTSTPATRSGAVC
jgi:hypothetical protein